MNSNGGSSAITAIHQHKQSIVGGNNKQGSANSVSPYFNTTTANSPPKKNATAHRRKHTDVNTTPNPSPNRQQLAKKSCRRRGSTQSKYFKKKMASSNNTPPPVALKDDADKSIVVHDSSPLLSSVSHINQPHHTTSKICTYDVGGVQTTMKASPVSTPDRKPFGDIGNSPRKLRNSATRSSTKSSLSQQSPSFIALQPLGTATKTLEPPPLLEQEDANLTTISNVNATDTLPATLPVATPTYTRELTPIHEIEATLKKSGVDINSDKSKRLQRSAIRFSSRNGGDRLPDDMNAILYQSKPSNVNKERVRRTRRYYSYFEYSIGDKAFYRGMISATDAANAFTELGFAVDRTTIRRRAGKDGGEPSLLGDRITVKEVIDCIFDYETGFVGTNEEDVETSKDMIRNNLPPHLSEAVTRIESAFSRVTAQMTEENEKNFARIEAEEKEKRAKEEKQRLINESFGPIDRSVVEDIINAHEKEQAEIKDNLSRVYQKYVNELNSDIDRLGGEELMALVKYICKIENKDTPSQHCRSKTKMKKRLAECIPSWTSYFT